MKKKLSKKLLLNKETISKLQDEESKNIKGGVTMCIDTCTCKSDESCSFQGNCCPPPENYNIG